MPELVRGQSVMKKLFTMHLQGGLWVYACVSDGLTLSADILLQAKSILVRTVPILSRYSIEHSAVADIVQGVANTLQDEHDQLEVIGT